MRFLMSAIESLTEIIGRVAGWALLLMGILITYEVIMRYAFVSPTSWVAEVSQQIQIWVVFLGAAYVLKKREMITIELILKDRDSVGRKLAESFGLVILFVLTLPAIWYGVEIWMRSTRLGHTTDTILALPRWFTDASVWLGFALLSLQAVVELWKIWTIGIPEGSGDPLDGAH